LSTTEVGTKACTVGSGILKIHTKAGADGLEKAPAASAAASSVALIIKPPPRVVPPPTRVDSPGASSSTYAAVGMDSLPAWAFVGPFDARRWKSVLEEAGCDAESQQQLFLLATLTDEGKFYANHCIGLVLKKLSDAKSSYYKKSGLSVWKTNPSGFLHKSVMDVRHKLMAKYGIASTTW
jgi:hypothetical protein